MAIGQAERFVIDEEKKLSINTILICCEKRLMVGVYLLNHLLNRLFKNR